MYKEASHPKTPVQRYFGRVKSRRKGPEAKVKLVYERTSKIVSLATV